MQNKLQQYFPMIRTRKEIHQIIQSNPKLQNMFYGWKEEQRENFLDLCTGVKGVKMMYDFMGKEILDPESTPERVNELLSLLLKQKVEIIEVLPNEGTRLADESTLLIKDIVVQLEDGSIVNLEIQKIGYMFPSERGACYSADLLLRQYRRIRSRLSDKNKFSYKDIKPVYTIVLFETSPEIFHKYPENYIHYFEHVSDTGIKMNLLQKYIFVPLDIFKKIHHNENRTIKIENRLDAWLAFLCMDDPEVIIEIIERYPDFKEMYEQVYEICQNVEEVMNMFSKELLELDRNTTKLMIDEMQKDIEQKDEMIRQKNEALAQKDDEIRKLKEQLQKQK